jgi:hypothetical protein
MFTGNGHVVGPAKDEAGVGVRRYGVADPLVDIPLEIFGGEAPKG